MIFHLILGVALFLAIVIAAARAERRHCNPETRSWRKRPSDNHGHE